VEDRNRSPKYRRRRNIVRKGKPIQGKRGRFSTLRRRRANEYKLIYSAIVK